MEENQVRIRIGKTNKVLKISGFKICNTLF